MDTSDKKKGKPSKIVFAISVAAILLAIIHLIWPSIAIDGVTLVLIIISILPWAAPWIETVELPGGYKISLRRELTDIVERADVAGLLEPEPQATIQTHTFQRIADSDPNLALAGLRIEIEKRLVQLAEYSGIAEDRNMGIGRLLNVLKQNQALSFEQISILSDMTQTLNKAVHGASVDSNTASWVINAGSKLLASLDKKISEVQSKNASS